MRTGVTVITVLSLIITLAPVVSFAGDSPEGLPVTLSEVGLNFRDQIKKVMDEYRGLAQANQALKAAGASYQKSLTAPTEKLPRPVTPAQQAVMAGVYTFDAGYAALFQRKKEMGHALGARKALNEKMGLTMPLSPRMKALIQNPDSIRDFSAWTDALNEAAENFLTGDTMSDRHLATVVNTVYGMIVEGMYIVTESIALDDYSPKMLALLNTQHQRIEFMAKVINVFRDNPAFKKAVGFGARLDFIDQVRNRLTDERFTPQAVDAIRTLIAPERQAILEGNLRGFAQN